MNQQEFQEKINDLASLSTGLTTMGLLALIIWSVISYAVEKDLV